MPENDKQSGEQGTQQAPPSDPAKPTPAAAAVKEKTKARPQNSPGRLPPYNVVLLDDDDHTAPYVVEMLAAVCGHPPETGYRMAEEVDSTGRVIVLTTHKERAEFKRDQILGYGADPRSEGCKGSMRAIIEPAEG